MFDAKTFLQMLTSAPGVYQMFGPIVDGQRQVLYVGKAKNLKKRVSSYFLKNQISVKTQALVKQIDDIKIIVTHTENEALILENNLIKQHRPRYNILFRDDKTYPYIYLSLHQDFPRLDFYRGKREEKGKFFGPYPSVTAVRQTLNLLQKSFKIRQCQDTFFSHRTRPCLQYQINRCTAPCVHYITKEEYQQSVNHAKLLLEGKGDEVISLLQAKMQEAANKQEYELASQYRDQIADLRKLQASQHVSLEKGDSDVISVVMQANLVCIQILTVREGQLLGKHSVFPKIQEGTLPAEVLSAFISYYYLENNQELPKEIIISHELVDQDFISAALSEKAGRKVNIKNPKRGERLHLLELAHTNAKVSLESQFSEKLTVLYQLEKLQELLQLTHVPRRIECFDISHTQGEATVASCVVFGAEGESRKDYRRFNIHDITPGDDYAAMRQALMRRYSRLKKEGKTFPDLLLIDGGKIQMKQAEEVLELLDIHSVTILGIAKGTTRKPGLETLFLSGKAAPLHYEVDSPALLLLQHIRDEAHRFAITGHRKQRAKKRVTSILESIEGIGKKRRQLLLHHFGGIQGVREASLENLLKVPGVSAKLAQKIIEEMRKQ